jgi:hypothetical protein
VARSGKWRLPSVDRVNRAAISRLILAFLLLVSQAAAQSANIPQPDRSFNLGVPVSHPEDLSGIWEAPDGHGGAVGLHLTFDTTTPVDAQSLAGVPQKWLGLAVGIYHRTGPISLPLQESSFSDSLRGGSVRYQDGRLTLNAPPDYDLDLRRISGDRWSGRFHRQDFDANITLVRPSQDDPGQPWFIGVWLARRGLETTCLHIAQASPGSFLSWSDTLNAWGAARVGQQTARPPYAWQRYGDLVGITPAAKNSVWIELNAGSAICCPHRFLATPAGRKGMNADWPAGPNQSAHKSRWTRTPGSTCIAPAP